MGASEGFQSLCGHSSDSTLPLFSFQLRVLRDWYEFEYRSDHLYRVTLDYAFHSMSLSCFLPRAFVFLSWLDPPSSLGCHSLDASGICSWSSYFSTVHLSRARYFIIRLILDSIFDLMLIFSLQKGERHIFTFTLFLRESPWSPYHFFSYGARVEGWFKYICL